MPHSILEVEVTIQDHFFIEAADASHRLVPCFDRSTAPISTDLWKHWFNRWLNELYSYLPTGDRDEHCYELTVRLTDDDEIQAFNSQYRHKNQPTDVLAFAALEVDYPQLEAFDLEASADDFLYLGDIVISVETAQRQAAQLGHSLQQELAWLAAHALLHLLGWDHPDQDCLLRMLKQQETLLQTVGLSIDYHQIENLIRQDYLDTPSDTDLCNL
ncbi:rRNA maturation RNase YbeY [Thermocoleostomius sinensis]|jgi:probable rRNA maturation factor|uniref:Endoribonuclease YbeY n=1 Tax=Thermocoleostomius sinensis A174 TaxID=2016057 RepID=A0A9E8ZG54_9CYAN|nr:rRNA maturation RNase YbeY [Thermocoleostomius sinensis]WAL61167.1 rRNA maturation RNase YbeY [Thermocoleostomius sinensis A174]